MGIRERKEKEKEQLRASILKEATKMFLEEGFEKTSMRKIAQKIEYSVGTLYLYYKNKNELFYEVQAVAFGHFLNYMKPLMDISDPVQRLEKIGETYMFFALNNREYYDLMFLMEAPMESVHENEGWKIGKKSFEILVVTVMECMEKGYFSGKNPKTVAMSFWGCVHGLVSLHIKNRLTKMTDYFDDVEQVMKEAKNLMMSKMLS